MRSAGMRIPGIIDEFAAVECELAHTRQSLAGIYSASDGAPTTRWVAAAICARNPIDHQLLLPENERP